MIVTKPSLKAQEEVKSDVKRDRPVVVLAEDSRVQGKVLLHRMNDLGYAAHLAFDGTQAFELIQLHRPDVVVTDIEMPGMSGYELCRRIKDHSVLSKTPVILLSTLSEVEDIVLGLDAGADAYIVKPYGAAQLDSQIKSLLAQDPQHDELAADDSDIPIAIGGKQFVIRSGRRQALNLLVSTFEHAVRQNKQLHQSNEELMLAREKLLVTNTQLDRLNKQLGDFNERMSRDLIAAAKIQQSLLPTEPPETPLLSVAWNYFPCEELAGDFLNYAMLDENHLAMYVVDVSGHGAASALLAVAIGRVLSPVVSATSLMLRNDSFTGKPAITPPSVVVAELNRRFPMASQGGLHFTILYGVLNLQTRLFKYACAGHPQPVRLTRDGKATFAPGDGFAVGWIDDADFDEFTLQLDQGDRLILYSDGIPEALDASLEQFTNSRMLQLFSDTVNLDLDRQVAQVCSAVKRWGEPNGLKDDVSILAVELK